MDEINEKENEKKGKGRGRMILGLALIVVAVMIFSYRNGFFDMHSKGNMTDAEYLSEQLTDQMKDLDAFLLEELALASEGKGTAVGKVQVKSDNALSFLLSNVSLDLHYTENGYAITVPELNINVANYDFGDIDIKQLASNKMIRSSKFKKLIEKYRLVYFNELFKNAITSSNDGFINNLNGVILVETEMDFELTEEDFDRAYKTCLNEAREDRKLKKAYKAYAESDLTYEEFLDDLENKDRKKGHFDHGKISGAFYINVKQGITMADLFIEPSESSGDVSSRHIKIGYTYLNREVGFVLDYDDGTNVINVLGNGIYNKSKSSLNAMGKVFAKGPKVPETEGMSRDFTINELQVFRAGEVYASGIIAFAEEKTPDKKTYVVFESENDLQTIKIEKNDGTQNASETVVYIRR